GDRVGLLMEKSPENLAALFGILKAGAGYVPLPLADPPARICQLIADCGMQILCATSLQIQKLDLASHATLEHVIVLGDQYDAQVDGLHVYSWSAVEKTSSECLSFSVGREDLAYVIYTSGSTGKPKGVMINHGGVLDMVAWATEYFELGPQDRIANVAPLQFDVSVFDIFSSVAARATLLPVPAIVCAFPYRLAEFLAAQSITFLFSVSSLMVNLVLKGSLGRHDLSALREILFGGEFFPLSSLQALVRDVPSARFHNLYGVTEATVLSTCHTFTAAPSQPIHVGPAVATTRIHVVDDGGRPVPADREGEIWISGPAIMQGYCGMADETERAFSSTAADRTADVAYRTGDRGRLDSQGNLHVIGRRDQMVKHRGYRIELSEIESVLGEHSDVAEVAAFCGGDDDSEPGLWVAVATTASDQELATHCAEKLPVYMVPGKFHRLDALPHTATGKVDRNQTMQLLRPFQRTLGNDPLSPGAMIQK
ncbi:MAG TPA: amino acid adenylation domain-containing protein, partial [Fuerstia sp.]|nr:amino acid adenylation domain-containing protein [Fuerstiella sp.]